MRLNYVGISDVEENANIVVIRNIEPDSLAGSSSRRVELRSILSTALKIVTNMLTR